MTEQRVIGNNGKLPWSIPRDLALFKQLTQGNTVLMGRKTFDSLPKKPLPDRQNIVLTSQQLTFPDVDFCQTLEQALETAQSYQKPIFVMGGASIYQLTLPLADRLYISHIKYPYPGDAYFPEFDPDEWQWTFEHRLQEFNFRTYKRISPSNAF